MIQKEFSFVVRKRIWLGLFLLLIPFSATTADDMTSTLMIGGSRIDVTIQSSETPNAPLSQPDVMKWVQSAAESVAAYYGASLFLISRCASSRFDGTGVRHGTTWGREGGLIVIHAGNKTTPADFAEDWMLTHEMIHLAFPSMADEHHWIEEGLSVYVEPIARIRAGHWTALQMWSDLVRDMPKGLPKEGDAGLDHTHTWGRTYWGGALFCFVADVEIRKQTKNKKGLEDALRSILNAGGDIREDWPIVNALKIGDQAAGVEILQKMYAEWNDKPVQVDLAAMWKQLGIEANGATVILHDDAPLAAIRRSIETGTPTEKAGRGTKAKAAPSESDAAAPRKPLVVFVGRTAGGKT